MDKSLANRTMVISGGSRGIGLAIATEVARLGGNIVLLAKTDKPDPRLPGTIHTAVEEIEAAGGRAIPVVGDVRNEADVQRAVDTAVAEFGGIDICLNNASVLNLSGTVDLPLKRFDLMNQVNVRGTFVLTQACLPHLLKSPNAHILTLSPPINMSPRWLGAHPGYMLAKYGMTLLTQGWAHEFETVAANCLWPETLIATAAVANLLDGGDKIDRARSPQIVADAATRIFASAPGEINGQCLIDSEFLSAQGVDVDALYGSAAGKDPDIFIG